MKYPLNTDLSVDLTTLDKGGASLVICMCWPWRYLGAFLCNNLWVVIAQWRDTTSIPCHPYNSAQGSILYLGFYDIGRAQDGGAKRFVFVQHLPDG